MRHILLGRLLPSVLVVGGCAATSPLPPPPLPPPPLPPPLLPADAGSPVGRTFTELNFPEDIEHRAIADGQAQPPSAPPPGLSFQSAAAVRQDGKRLALDLWVTNPTSEAVVVPVVPIGGSFPYGGQSPLTLTFSSAALSTVRYAGQMFPPEPPQPMAITLPPVSRVRFSADLDTGNYAYEGHPEVSLEWAFHLLGGDSPRGTIDARLP